MSKLNTIDYSKFYYLHDMLADQPLRLSPTHTQEWLTIERASQLFEGKWQPPEPVQLKAEMGGRVTDFLWTTMPPLFCISKRVKELFETNNFTGWAVYPVEVYDRKGEYLSDYCGFAVISHAGELDISRSPVVRGKIFNEVYKGMYFTADRWDGSNIFRLNHYIIVTEAVKMALNHAKIINIRLETLPEVEIIKAIIDIKNKKYA